MLWLSQLEALKRPHKVGGRFGYAVRLRRGLNCLWFYSSAGVPKSESGSVEALCSSASHRAIPTGASDHGRENLLSSLFMGSATRTY